MRLAASVSRFWSARGRYARGRRELVAALELAGPSTTALRAKTLVRAAGLAMVQNDTAFAKPMLEESLAICRTLGDRKGTARALSGLGVVAMYASDFDTAKRIGLEGLEIYRELGERRGVALATHNLAVIEWARRDVLAARTTFQAALTALQELGDQASVALTLSGLATAELYLPEPDPEGARAHLATGLEIVRRLEAAREGIYLIEAVANLAVCTGHPGVGARLIGAASALRESANSPAIALEREELAVLRTRAVESLGELAVEAAWGAGRRLSFEEALAESAAVLGVGGEPERG
jgi:tetratricopeptide (TPR) repeat protein